MTDRPTSSGSDRYTEETPLSAQESRRSHHRRGSQRRALSAAGLALAALTVAGCGGGSNGTSAPAGTTPSPGSSANPNLGADFGAVSGKILSITSAGASVQPAASQSSSSPTIVAWASSTQFSKLSAVTLSSLAKGDCVMVMSKRSNAATAPTTVTATRVSVTGTSGCSARGRFGGGSSGGGFGNGTPPSGSPEGGTASPNPRLSGAPGGRGGFGRGFGGAFGTIASITKSAFVVKSSFGSTMIDVKTTSSTTYTATSSTTSSALVAGQCASAIGAKTSNGTIDARTITISSPTNGTCADTSLGGFGGGGFAGRGGFGSAPPVSNA